MVFIFLFKPQLSLCLNNPLSKSIQQTLRKGKAQVQPHVQKSAASESIIATRSVSA